MLLCNIVETKDEASEWLTDWLNEWMGKPSIKWEKLHRIKKKTCEMSEYKHTSVSFAATC